MKKLALVISVSFLMMQSVNGQITDTALANKNQLLHDSYVKKYKTNLTAGRVLLGTGIGITVIGGIVFASYAGQGFNGPAPVSEETLFFFIGPGAALASIPFFASAKRNKKKAELVLKGESVTLGSKLFYQCNYTALAVTIPL